MADVVVPEKTLRTIHALAVEYAETIEENLTWEEQVSLDEMRVILGVPSSGE